MLTLGTSPATLPYVKSASHRPRISLSCFLVYESLLCLNNGAGLPFVIYTQHLTPHLKLPPLAAHRNWLEELDLALAIKHVLGIELGDSGDGRRVGARVKVDDFLIRVLEGKDDGVGREGCKLRMELLYSRQKKDGNIGKRLDSDGNVLFDYTHIEEMQLIRVCSSNACREKQQISLHPRHLEAWELESHTRSLFAHVCTLDASPQERLQRLSKAARGQLER